MFKEKLNKIIEHKKSMVCVGLDTTIAKIPKHLHGEIDPLFAFNKAIIDATKQYVAAYKMNIAFYESLGMAGWELLEKTLSIIPSGILTIADAKRADIENTGRKYAETFFSHYNFDAITVAPYMGMDSVTPFLEYEDRGVFILCLTSNPGAKDFQFMKVDGRPMYEHVAKKIMEWNFLYGNCALVVGGTHTDPIRDIRSLTGDLPFLVPGIGAQGGNLEMVINYATDAHGRGILVNSSRTIIFASTEKDFDIVAGQRARQLRDQINLLVSVKKNPGIIDMN